MYHMKVVSRLARNRSPIIKLSSCPLKPPIFVWPYTSALFMICLLLWLFHMSASWHACCNFSCIHRPAHWDFLDELIYWNTSVLPLCVVFIYKLSHSMSVSWCSFKSATSFLEDLFSAIEMICMSTICVKAAWKHHCYKQRKEASTLANRQKEVKTHFPFTGDSKRKIWPKFLSLNLPLVKELVKASITKIKYLINKRNPSCVFSSVVVRSQKMTQSK